MTTSNEKETIYLLAECVNKHNGRFDKATIRHFASSDNDPVSAIHQRILDIYFISRIDIDEFKKSCQNAGLQVVCKSSDTFMFSKSEKVYNDFEQLKNEYKGDLNLVKKMINGKFRVQNVDNPLTMDLMLEHTQFRAHFNELNIDYLTRTNQEFINNIKSNKLTINWTCLFENYEKFDSIDIAANAFVNELITFRPTGYNVYSHDQHIVMYPSIMVPIVIAELNAYIASKKTKPEYTIEQAKKDLETGQALIQKAVSFLTK